jgi:hypothetical protein
MRIYACYTPSHFDMYSAHFGSSLPKDLEPCVKAIGQQSKTGAFGSPGFQETCCEKVEQWISAVKENTSPFVVSDVDVHFYGPVSADLVNCLGDADIAFQQDGPAGNCTGFFVVRPSLLMQRFFESVLARMRANNELDQDAVRNELANWPTIKAIPLPARYWSIGSTGIHWVPGMPVAPPKDLLVHHANWTTGVENKLVFLDLVKATHEGTAISPEAFLKRHIAIESARQRVWHHEMPLALVLQFWRKDKAQALALARLIADIEPEFRDDVIFVFARQENTPMDHEIYETQLYVGLKMPFADMPTRVDESKEYPGICFDPWASACEKLSRAYHTGKRKHHSAFFFEADGCPMGKYWIDHLKGAHEQTLTLGKRVTGPRMRWEPHVNGTMVMHLSCWEDHPSLRQCPPSRPWDIFHGQVLLSELGPSQIIANRYGDQNMSEQVWFTTSINAAWSTSCKDGLAQYWARRRLVHP